MHAYSIISIILSIASFGAILYVGLKTDILRETPNQNSDHKPMFSLGRFQLWIWTLFICPIFVLFWGFDVLHAINLNTTAVLLLGIPSGVAVTSLVISSSQSSDLTETDHTISQIKARSKSASTDIPTAQAVSSVAPPVILKIHQPTKSFFIDLISDDSGQLSLGRLQQLIFTMVFLVIYISTFFQSGMQTLPVFENEVFAMMGISSGTYLVSKGLNK